MPVEQTDTEGTVVIDPEADDVSRREVVSDWLSGASGFLSVTLAIVGFDSSFNPWKGVGFAPGQFWHDVGLIVVCLLSYLTSAAIVQLASRRLMGLGAALPPNAIYCCLLAMVACCIEAVGSVADIRSTWAALVVFSVLSAASTVMALHTGSRVQLVASAAASIGVNMAWVLAAFWVWWHP